MHRILHLGAPIPLGTIQSVALPARWVSQKILAQKWTPSFAYVVTHLGPTCPRSRPFGTDSATQTAKPEIEYLESFEDQYLETPDSLNIQKPVFKKSWLSGRERDTASTDAKSTLSQDGNSRQKIKGRKRHQIIKQINAKYKITQPFIPFFDYKEWGFLRHQYTSEELPRYRKMHKFWKGHCQDVRLDRWELKFHLAGSENLKTCTDSDQMAAIWEGMDFDKLPKSKDSVFKDILSVWRPTILSLTTIDAKLGIMFLEATTRGSWKPEGYMVSDIIRLVAEKVDVMEGGLVRTYLSNYIIDIAMVMMLRMGPKAIPWRQNDLYRIIRHTDTKKCLEFYMLLMEQGTPVHQNTMAQMAYRFARNPEYKLFALRIITEVMSGIPGAEKQAMWSKICTTLFITRRNDDQNATSGTSTQEMWASLISTGFTPNLIHFTSLMKYLIQEDLSETAWQMVDVLLEHDVRPDSVFYATILDGVRKKMDFNSFQNTLNMIAQSNTANPIVWNTAMNIIASYAFHEAFHKGLAYPRVLPIFQPLLHIYERVFDMAPLRTLIPLEMFNLPADDLHDWRFSELLHPIYNILPESGSQKLEPSNITLIVMLLAFLRNVPKASDIVTFYGNFRQLYLSGDPVTGRFVEEHGTIVYDMVMKALTQWPKMVRMVVDVFMDMSKSLPSGTASATQDEKPKQNKSKSRAADQSKPQFSGKQVSQDESEQDTTSTFEANGDFGAHNITHTTSSKKAKLPQHPQPSIYSWCILLHAWMIHRAGNPDAITQLMMRNGVVPTLVTWNTLISGYSRLQSADGVLKSLQSIHHMGYKPDDWTMRAFFKLKDRDRVLATLQETIEKEAQLTCNDEGEQ